MKNPKLSKLFYFLNIALVSFLLVGCASGGNEKVGAESKRSIAKMVIPHVTTRAEVERIFGKPDNISFTTENLEVWRYFYCHSRLSANMYIPIFGVLGPVSTTKTKTLIIYFDVDNKVLKYTFDIEKTHD